MGRKLFFAKRDEKRRLQRERNGYVPGAHRQEDSIREKDKRLPKTNSLHQQTVDLWLKFTADPENGFEYYKTSLGCPAPSHEMIKEFIRWYIGSTQGRLSENERPTVRTVNACAERFFGGFEAFTKTKIIPDDRKEIKTWIKKTLTAEGTIANQKKEKLNFTRNDFLRTVSSLWQTDHKTFIPGLLKVVILFALQLYLFTGARVGSFIPSSEDKHERGLRYKHIDLVLFPSSTAPWAVGWRVNQVWLKNNRCPQYTVFGIGIRDSNRPQFASGYLLLSLALAHGALFGVNTVDDLAKFDLSNGEIPLRWKNEYLEKPVLRHATADGPQETPLTKQKFCSCLRQIFTAAGYFGELATIHCLRRNLGKKIERRHGSAPVSQIMAHRGPGTFPEHYQAHCSSIDTVSAVLDEENQPDHIEYFQGYVQFYERGLPGELTAETKESILDKPDMVEIRDRIKFFEQSRDEKSLKNGKLEYRKALVRHRLFELKQYQNRWVQEKRDQKILNRGKEEPMPLENDIRTRAQMLIMPEAARIATAMSCAKVLSFDEKLLLVQDLQTQCARDFDVVYLPNESPIQGLCPAKGCQINISSLRKCDRSVHIHECVRREKAFGLQVSESRMRFCYECMEWLLSSQWRNHCDVHLQSWQVQHCEVIIYRHTVIRPGYCPFCLWDLDLPAEDRLQYWLRSDNLREHIEGQHMAGIQWSTKKQMCGCSRTFDNERDLRHHLHDEHGLNEAIWQNPKPPRKRKRACRVEAQSSATEPEERPKKIRFHRYPPPRHEHEHYLSNKIFVPVPNLLAFVEERPEQYCCSSTSDKSGSSSKSSSVASCFSAANSPLSSRPTTPGLEVIDPRILESFDLSKENGNWSCNQVSIQLDSLSLSSERETKDESSSEGIQPPPPVPSLVNHPIGDSVGNKANEEAKKALQKDFPALMPPSGQAVAVEDKRRNCFPTQTDAGDGNPPHDDQIHVARLCKPLSRAKTRSQLPLHHTDDLSTRKPRRKLNAKEKRKLLELKDQNLTLRQIGHQFVDIDTTYLRQVDKIQVNNENPSDRGAEDGEWRGRTRRVTVLAREATILDDDYQPSNEEDGRLPPENKITAPTIDAFDYVSPNHPLCPTRAICVLDSAQQLARLRHHFEFWWDVLVAMDKQAKMNTNLTDQRIREVIRLGEENRELRREQDYMTVQRDMAEKRVEELISKLDGAYRERDRDQSIIALMNTTRQAKPATEGNNRDCVPHRDPMHDAHRFLWNISVDHENCPSSVTNALGTDPGTDDSALASCRPESAQKHTLPTNGKVDSPQTFLEDTCRKRRLSSTFISQEALPTRNRRPRLHNSLSQTASAIPELDKDRWEGRFSRHLLLSNLLPDEKDEIERKSNHVLRSDLAEFMEKYTKIWNSTGFWSSTSLDPSNNNTSVGGKGHETWRYVEAMQAKGETHYLKSRLADIMLYLEYVKEFNRQKKAGHPGQTAKTRATNVICGTASLPKVTAEKTRASFHQHKLIGERWWWSGCYLGHGFILLCSEETGKKVRNKYFKLDAFILYLLYNCRRTLACCREADDVVDMLLTDGKFPVQVSKEEVQQWIKDASCTNQENELIFHWQAWSTDAVASKASDFLSARLSTDFDQPELGDFSVLKRRPGEASG